MNTSPDLAATIFNALIDNPDAAVTLDTARPGRFTYSTLLENGCGIVVTYHAVFTEYRASYYEPHYNGTTEFLAVDIFAAMADRHERQNTTH